MHGWYTCRVMMVGSPSTCFCWRPGRELEEYDCAQTSTESRRLARGSSTDMVGVSLCLSPRIPRWQLKWAGPACPLVQALVQVLVQVPVHGPPRLTHRPSPTRGPFLFADFPLPSSSATVHLSCSVLTSPIFHLPNAPCRSHGQHRGSSHARRHKQPLVPIFRSCLLRCHRLGTLRSAPSPAPRPPRRLQQ